MYYKSVEGNYIIYISTSCGETEITEEEYNGIVDALANKPTASGGTDYRLKTDLTWEAYQLPEPPQYDPDPTPDEALDFLFGDGGES